MSVINLDRIEELLRNDDSTMLSTSRNPVVSALCIPRHEYNRNTILQFSGWAIVLQADGTYYWEATDGG